MNFIYLKRFSGVVVRLDMIVVNTCYRKSEEYRITYRSGPSASQIDYFTVRQADRKYIKDCTVIPGEAAVKQHRILVMDMRIRNVKTGYRPKQKPCIRNWKLKGENLAKFKCEVQQKHWSSWFSLVTSQFRCIRVAVQSPH